MLRVGASIKIFIRKLNILNIFRGMHSNIKKCLIQNEIRHLQGYMAVFACGYFYPFPPSANVGFLIFLSCSIVLLLSGKLTLLING